MKKIVALVLSLVMVLGLATTAFGAVTYDVKNANGEQIYQAEGVTPEKHKATYDKKAGTGTVEYYTIAGWNFEMVECAKVDADFYLTYHGEDDAVLYLAKADYVDYTVAKPYTNIGDECGMLSVNDESLDYFVVTDDKGFETYYVEAEVGTEALMVAGEMVNVADAGDEEDLVPHDWAVLTVDKDHNATALKCEECEKVANVYPTKLAAPAGAIEYAPYGWIAIAAPAADAETDKVESAETFDAGIAMYVGMSVMAAAGSAVVLKKKD